MQSRNVRGGQGGFTLIEIIAVLVILGILAAVAVPRFVDLQDDARTKGLEGLVSAAQSQLHMEYAKSLLDTGDASSAWSAISGGSAQALCDKVSADGWLDSATLTCSGSPISIVASHTDATTDASSTFSDPSN